MALRKGLGKGLDAIFEQSVPDAEHVGDLEPSAKSAKKADPQAASARNASLVQMIPLAHINANPDQPRKSFNSGELAELADSIRELGIIQPIIVEERSEDDFVIVAGERRARAAKIAGIKEVPAIVRKFNDEKKLIVSIIENVQRADLNPIEEAAAYKNLMDLTGLSQDETAARVGKNRSTVANALRLLKLSPEMQKSIQDGTISPGHARAVLSVSGIRNQQILYQTIIKKKLSVREAEKQAAALNQQNTPRDKPESPPRDAELDAIEDKFMKSLGTKVKILGDENKGTIAISYYSKDDLNRLYEIITR